MDSRKELRSLCARTGLVTILFWFALSASLRIAASDELSPVGTWATDNGISHVKIEQCGVNLCGTIVWLKKPLGDDGKAAVDSKNPDSNLHGQKLVGLRLLSGFEQNSADPNAWTKGHIYDPDDGRTYSCNLTVQDKNTLRVRGYVGFSLLGKTQVWTRVQ
ncbi:MAG TPA: DUF2147 domain-containing protein [Candidatus Binataceae bacterium]|jgi:uncharacterized protein (DUF2147 family)